MCVCVREREREREGERDRQTDRETWKNWSLTKHPPLLNVVLEKRIMNDETFE